MMKLFKSGGKFYKTNLHVAVVLIEFVLGTVGVYGLLCLLMALPV